MRKTTRRKFLKHSAVAGVLAGAPTIWTRSVACAQDANSRPTIAAIGVGGSRGRYNQGGNIARQAAKFGQMIACCDVDDLHTSEFNADFDNKLNLYRDYRELFDKERPDIVTIGTPDHWHVPIATAAIQADCDVYCEKPLTLTIQEGMEICHLVKETGKIFQVGTQQRSENGRLFLKAIAMVQSGRLGNNVNAYVAIGGAPAERPFESIEAPSDLDWNMWLGPAPEVGYSEQRRRMFRWWFEYSGGKMTDWGAHHIDIAQWALGCENTGPLRISGTGSFPPIVPDNFAWNAYLNNEIQLPNAYNTPTAFSVDLELVNGSVINVNHHYKREEDDIDFDNGILFEGDGGRIFVNRHRITGRPVEDLTEADNQELDDLIVKLYRGKTPGNHMKNFFQCIEERVQPISDVFTHHKTMTSCHLCNIALMLGRSLRWDPDNEQFIGDDQATSLMLRRPRETFV